MLLQAAPKPAHLPQAAQPVYVVDGRLALALGGRSGAEVGGELKQHWSQVGAQPLAAGLHSKGREDRVGAKMLLHHCKPSATSTCRQPAWHLGTIVPRQERFPALTQKRAQEPTKFSSTFSRLRWLYSCGACSARVASGKVRGSACRGHQAPENCSQDVPYVNAQVASRSVAMRLHFHMLFKHAELFGMSALMRTLMAYLKVERAAAALHGRWSSCRAMLVSQTANSLQHS